jgi:3-oxoacyl-[acyl-carrier protein] reductase
LEIVSFDLTGQTGIVTGAATGIGEAIAHRLAGAGATIAIVDLDLAGAQYVADAIGNGSFAVRADVSNAKEVGEAVDEVLKRTGRIDILVNNAGIAGPSAPIWQQTDEQWQRNIAINLTGVFNFCRAVIPHMRERRYGALWSIVCLSTPPVRFAAKSQAPVTPKSFLASSILPKTMAAVC